MRLILWLACLMSACVPAWAGTLYVRTVGNDANTGQSPATAVRTLNRALALAQPGDTIYVGRGTYTGAVASVRSGTPTARIRVVGDYQGVFTGDPRGTPTIDATGAATLTVSHNYIDFERINIRRGTRCVVWSGVDGMLRSCVIRSATDDGVLVTGGSLSLVSCTVRDAGVVATGNASVTLSSCTLRDIPGGAVLSQTTGAVRVEQCTLQNNPGWGITAESGSVTVVNTLFRPGGGGMLVGRIGVAGPTVTAWNNTLVSQASAGVRVQSGSATVRNSIFYTSTRGLDLDGGALTHSHNLFFGNTTDHEGTSAQTTDVFADPRFINPSSNWNIQSTSPAIDVGMNGATITTVDRRGQPRPRGPAFDIGAYEVTGPSATIPYFTDFEAASTPGPEWTSTTTASSATLTRFAGAHGNTSLSLRLSTVAGRDYTLIFDACMLDSWDGVSTTVGPDVFFVNVDGEEVWRATYAFPTHYGRSANAYSWPDVPEVWGQNLVAYQWEDAIFRRVVIEFTAETTSTFISFGASNLQGLNDESWGIDNVRVVQSSQAAPYLPAYIESGRFRGFGFAVSSGQSAGLAFGDIDANLWPGVMLTGGATTRLLSNTNGTFVPLAVPAFSAQGAFADLNADGHLDFAGLVNGQPRAVINNGSGTLDTSSLLTVPGQSGAEGLVAADLNADGLCDVAILGPSGNLALLASRDANGVVTFTPAPAMLPGGAPNAGDGDSVSSADVNADGFPDFFYHYNGGRLFLSDGAGGYVGAALPGGVATGGAHKMGSAWVDYDNDGDLDLFVARRQRGATPYLFRNTGGSFANVASTAGLTTTAGVVGCAFGDFDNDGDQDLFLTAANGQGELYGNGGAPTWTFTRDDLQGVSTRTRAGGCAFVDIDLDGNLDLAVSGELATNTTLLFSNQLASTRYLLVRVLGRGPGGINHAGAGTRVELWNEDNTAFIARRDIGVASGHAGQLPLVAHFGGVNPAATYTLRVYAPRRVYTTQVTPALAETSTGAQTIAQFYTFDESAFAPALRVTRWREHSPEE
ncbi:MAG: FG-GAP-like repeat-containing protein [Planctomycetota bacterium]|nr:FG-GAP-like repeat-containing protein [Planctomycetota bacterium]